MSNRGWEGGDIGSACAEASRPINNSIAPSSRPLLSFNSDNLDQIPLQNQGIDSDKLYDLPEDDPIEAPALRKKIRTVSQPNNRHHESTEGSSEVAVSHGLGGAEKRRRPTPARRVKSTYVTRGFPNNVPAVDDQHIERFDVELPASQLFTPPDTGKRIKKAAVPPKPRAQSRATAPMLGPFRNPSITKAVPCAKGKEQDDSTLTRSASNHQSWVTTVDAVRSGFIGLTQTTLNKLAAFRYQPISSNDVDEAQHHLVPPHFLPQDLEVPRSDETCDWEQTVDIMSKENGLEYQSHIPIHTHMKEANQMLELDGLAMFSDVGGASLLVSQSQHLVNPQGASDSFANFDDIFSSEIRLSPQPMTGAVLQQVIPQSPGLQVHNIEFDARGTTIQDSQRLEDLGCNEVMEPLSESQVEEEAFVEITLPIESPLDPQWFENGLPTYLMNTTSDMIDHGVVSNGVGKHSPEAEFDEGLDDLDFLALASGAVVRDQYPAPVSRTLRNTGGFNGSQGGSEKAAMISASVNDFHVTRQHQAIFDEPSVQCADEYPMDIDDEAAMLALPEVANEVTDNFMAPPKSLRYAFNNVSEPGEDYGTQPHFSPTNSTRMPCSIMNDVGEGQAMKSNCHASAEGSTNTEVTRFDEEDDWDIVQSKNSRAPSNLQASRAPNAIVGKTQGQDLPSDVARLKTSVAASPKIPDSQLSSPQIIWVLDDSHEYQLLKPFARPDFPTIALDRSPVIGLSPRSFLRVCFRIGEMFHEGVRSDGSKQDAIIELFARVTSSSREPGTTKQHFQFHDLWHDYPPYPDGVLPNYKLMGLTESESRIFVGAKEDIMARCLGKLRRSNTNSTGWLLHIINIRQTDWEEIRWTKNIVGAGFKSSERKSSRQ